MHSAGKMWIVLPGRADAAFPAVSVSPPLQTAWRWSGWDLALAGPVRNCVNGDRLAELARLPTDQTGFRTSRSPRWTPGGPSCASRSPM